MEIGVQNLAFAKEWVLVREGLFHLYDHLSFVVNFFRGLDQGGTGLAVVFIGDSRASPGFDLDEDLVSGLSQGANPGNHHSHAIFFILNLFWNTYDHDRLLQFEFHSVVSELDSFRESFSPDGVVEIVSHVGEHRFSGLYMSYDLKCLIEIEVRPVRFELQAIENEHRKILKLIERLFWNIAAISDVGNVIDAVGEGLL